MNINEWKWLNKSSMIEANGELAIIAPAQTDWFNNPIPEMVFCRIRWQTRRFSIQMSKVISFSGQKSGRTIAILTTPVP